MLDKDAAMSEILMYIEGVKEADRFEGKARLLKGLVMLYELVERYKPSGNYYDVCVKEAKRLFNTSREILNNVGQGDIHQGGG